MPQADPVYSTPRRALFLATSALLTSGATASTETPSVRTSRVRTPLIALASEHADNEEEQARIATQSECMDRQSLGLHKLQDRSDDLTTRSAEIVAQAVPMIAAMRTEIRAKVSLLRGAPGFALTELDAVSDDQHRLAWSIVRDLLDRPALLSGVEAI